MNLAPKIGLGTVQFGQDYGISNKIGRPSETEVSAILNLAAQNGIQILDTAPAYEASEDVLGRQIHRSSNFRIVTKTPKFKEPEIKPADAAVLRNSLQQSLNRLGLKSVYGLLMHDVDDLLKPGGELLALEMNKLVKEGFVQKIGISVYTAEQIDRALALFSPDITQVPINVFDQRLIASGHLAKCKSRKIEIHARSIFLQGLLLMPEGEIPETFSSIAPHIHDYHAELKKIGLSPLESALAFVRGIKELDTVIVGVCSSSQLDEIVRAWNKEETGMDFRPFFLRNEKIIDPRFWGVKKP